MRAEPALHNKKKKIKKKKNGQYGQPVVESYATWYNASRMNSREPKNQSRTIQDTPKI